MAILPDSVPASAAAEEASSEEAAVEEPAGAEEPAAAVLLEAVVPQAAKPIAIVPANNKEIHFFIINFILSHSIHLVSIPSFTAERFTFCASSPRVSGLSPVTWYMHTIPLFL